ncbi:MAG TPA: 3-hydroxybutyryl-CoA dehydrogenase [Acidiphilium sp.]|uniref:3-hydroxybutyryl-CoA dehydrogenase n=1 Tax=unclassified Acidiphilium TaxID=2617493 RepID=UPI000BDA2DC8|nr:MULTISPECIES: 3-hydroxybutyryl-CoA dehydrogenase [unclassified Acidiphilium]OYV57203.1 MAG: 3-hydroxybutyryl-CoA dehydrogenase [Acidiphilium sp. 20-67-58]HQT60612.1 3-hydroxybutyryl-CoA dehydrogenase [Acidiphilium sp.]HQU11078.1 3-hydroxybutyryl-CoA dehydrogenase [Acidiphilium sp.]
MEIRTLGVLGAGAMGNGIAHVAALSGLDVVLVDTAQAVLEKSMATMRKNLERQVQKGTIDAASEAAALARVSPMTTHDAFAACDMVIEAVPEREEIKRAVYAQVIPHLAPHAILASNTSSISITKLGRASGMAERFVGMHFFNPVPMMKLVEVIRGLETSDATVAAVEDLAKRMGKITIAAQDMPGFIVNRILVPMLNEAVFALHEGIGDVVSIDNGMKLGAGHPMGPLTLCDLVGLDVALEVMRVLHAGLGEDKYRPCPLLVNYVEAGWLGRKTGRGFYDYSTNPPTPTR